MQQNNLRFSRNDTCHRECKSNQLLCIWGKSHLVLSKGHLNNKDSHPIRDCTYFLLVLMWERTRNGKTSGFWPDSHSFFHHNWAATWKRHTADLWQATYLTLQRLQELECLQGRTHTLLPHLLPLQTYPFIQLSQVKRKRGWTNFTVQGKQMLHMFWRAARTTHLVHWQLHPHTDGAWSLQPWTQSQPKFSQNILSNAPPLPNDVPANALRTFYSSSALLPFNFLSLSDHSSFPKNEEQKQ